MQLDFFFIYSSESLILQPLLKALLGVLDILSVLLVSSFCRRCFRFSVAQALELKQLQGKKKSTIQLASVKRPNKLLLTILLLSLCCSLLPFFTHRNNSSEKGDSLA